ncbi:MAG: NADPH-dependent FMN reductase [Crocinitomix sp.]|nr:NADPH-dependent FMN reductase [Crocinitomix sp.]
MKKIIAFSGSNSSVSINTQVLNYVATVAEGVETIQLTDCDIPMYSMDMEQSTGIPADIITLQEKMVAADAVIMTTPEHNGLMPAFFKNILDWLSRTGVKYLENKPVIVMSVSPGGGGGKNAGDYVEKIIGYAGANVVGRFVVPSFNDNFDVNTRQIVNQELNDELNGYLAKL